jgi:hypothetical protein
LGINSPLVRVPPLRLPRSVVGLSVGCLGTEIQVGQPWLRAVGAVAVFAEARVVAWCPSECRSISKKVATVFFKSSAVVVCGVLFRKRHRIVASGARTEWRRKGCALELLGVHEKGVASIERSEVLIASFLCTIVRVKFYDCMCWNLPSSFLFLR